MVLNALQLRRIRYYLDYISDIKENNPAITPPFRPS